MNLQGNRIFLCYNRDTMHGEILNGYSIALPHLHTRESDGMVTAEKLFSDIAQAQQDLNAPILAAVTNHDTIRGLDKARCAADYFGVAMVPGEEITIGKFPPKHMLALFREDPDGPIRTANTVEGTIDRIKESDGLVIPAHPDGFYGMASLTSNELRNLGNKELIDGLEVISGTFDRREKLEPIVAELNRARPVAKIGSSDSHFGQKDLLTAATLFKGKTIDDFFHAVKEGTTIPLKGVKHTVTPMDRVIQNCYSNIVLNIRRLLKDLG